MNKNFPRIRALFSIYFVAAIDNIGLGIAFVLFAPIILEEHYQFISPYWSLSDKTLFLGFLYAAFPLAQFFGAPIIGDLADQYGRKRLFYITIIASIFSCLSTGISFAIKSPFSLLFTRFLSGFFAGNLSLCNASIADLSLNPKNRAKNYGLLTVVFGLSFPISILIGGYLSNPLIAPQFSPSFPFYVLSLLTLLSLGAIYFFYEEPFKKTYRHIELHITKGITHILQALQAKENRKYFLVLFWWTFGWRLSVNWYATYMIEKFEASQTMITWGFIIQGIFWTLGGALINPLLLKKIQVKTIASLSFGLIVLLLSLCSIMPTWTYLTYLYSFAAIFGSIALSSSFQLISTSFTENAQGKSMGIGQSMMSLGAFFTPIFGAILVNINISLFYPAAALFMFFGLFILKKK